MTVAVFILDVERLIKTIFEGTDPLKSGAEVSLNSCRSVANPEKLLMSPPTV